MDLHPSQFGGLRVRLLSLSVKRSPHQAYSDHEEQLEAMAMMMRMKTMVEMHGGNTDDGDQHTK